MSSGTKIAMPPAEQSGSNVENEESTESLVAEFRKYDKKISTYEIMKGKLVARAKAKGKNGFEDFCTSANIKPEASKTRKYLKIGIEADWLLSVAEQLPAEWTTIYDVAVLGQARAEDLINRGILHPQATAKELKEAAIAKSENDALEPTVMEDEMIVTTKSCLLQVDASDLSDPDRLALYCELQGAAARRGLTVTGLPDRLAEELIIKQEAA